MELTLEGTALICINEALRNTPTGATKIVLDLLPFNIMGLRNAAFAAVRQQMVSVWMTIFVGLINV